MTQQANPLNALNQMYGTLQGAWEDRARTQAGRAYAGGDMAGASNALAGAGLLQEAGAMREQQRAGEDRQRAQDMTGAMRDGNYGAARGLAMTPQELAQVEEALAGATEQQRAQAAHNAGQMAAIAEMVGGLPAEQQRAAVMQYAQQFGVDPSQIPEQITPQWIEGVRMQALGLEEYLKHQIEQEKLNRPLFSPFGAWMPPGTQAASPQAQPRSLGTQLDDDWEPVRPNQPPSAPAAGGGERSQQPRVSFRSSQEASQTVARMVPGVTVTNADRTPADTARLRRQGYKPSDTSFHLQGRALDLVPPRGMSMAQLADKMRQAGFRVLNEGHHVHVSW